MFMAWVYLLFITWFWPSVQHGRGVTYRYLVGATVFNDPFGGSGTVSASRLSSSSSSSSVSRRFDCKVCGYEYDEATGAKWEDLNSDEFTCPVCRAPKSMFADMTTAPPLHDQQSEKDIFYMRRALHLASLARGRTRPNPMVGCVIVDPTLDAIVGEGYHIKAGMDHAEVMVRKQSKPLTQLYVLQILTTTYRCFI